VYRKSLQKIIIGEFCISNFSVEIGAMDYGFDINGIIGMDFLIKSKCVVDVCKMQLFFC